MESVFAGWPDPPEMHSGHRGELPALLAGALNVDDRGGMVWHGIGCPVYPATDTCANPASTIRFCPVMPSLSSLARNRVERATWVESSRNFRH